MALAPGSAAEVFLPIEMQMCPYLGWCSVIGFVDVLALSTMSPDGSPRQVTKRCFSQLKCRLALIAKC